MADGIITRALAREKGLARYMTGNPCKQGHIVERYTASTMCVTCSVEVSKKYRENNQETINARKAEKYKADPERFRKIARKHHSKNRDKLIPKMREYYWQNAEKMRQYAVSYRKTHNQERRTWEQVRRARKALSSGRHTASDIRKMMALQQNKCANCHKRLHKYHIDHIMPLRLGGGNGPDNIQLLCPSCNLRKNSRHPLDWARMNGRLL